MASKWCYPFGNSEKQFDLYNLKYQEFIIKTRIKDITTFFSVSFNTVPSYDAEFVRHL